MTVATIRRTLSTIVLVVLVAALAVPAMADTITREDPNDSKGELDLASVRALHRSPGVDEIRVTTYQAFTNADVSLPSANFAISIDVNDRAPTDSRWKAEYWVYFWSTKRGFTALVWEPSTDRTSRVDAARLSARSARVVLPISRIGNPDSYRFAVWSYTEQSPCTAKDPCVDVVPNRLPLFLHDYTPPPVTLQAPKISTDESLTLDFPVTFEIADDRFGSGVDRWELQAKESTSSTWTTVTTGGSGGTLARDVTGVQGAVMQTRVLVWDNSGNRSISAVRKTVVPFDDTEPPAGVSIAYSPGWVASTGDGTRFLGTTHTAGPATDETITIGFTGTKACLQATYLSGTQTMTLDGAPLGGFALCRGGLTSGPHTLVVTYTGGEFRFDGVVVWP
jgi:hypothetical protein